MLASVQSFSAGSPAVFRRFHGAFHPRIWVHVVEQVGCIDEALVQNLSGGRPQLGRRLVGLSLGGLSSVRFQGRTGREFRPGEGLTCDGRGVFQARAENRRDQPSLSINIDWDATYFGSAGVGEPTACTVSQLPRLVRLVARLRDAIEAGAHNPERSGPTRECVADLLALLAADGFDVPRLEAPDLVTELDPQVCRMSRVLDHALSRTDEIPMLVDLEGALGLSKRTVQRLLPGVLAAWGQDTTLGVDGFRSIRSQVQLVRACLVMSHPDATCERAAELLGFSSPNVLCRAFLKRGLPSPGRVRERLRELEGG